MTKEQLIIPRYEVVADYPNSRFAVGDILQQAPLEYCFKVGVLTTSDTVIGIADVLAHPHLFHPLKWWEKREIGDMPEYVRINAVNHTNINNTFQKVEVWTDEAYLRASVNGGYWYSADELLPSDLAEFEAYLNRKK